MAVLRPFTAHDEEELQHARGEELAAMLDAYADRISAAWKSPLIAAEAVAEQRRGT